VIVVAFSPDGRSFLAGCQDGSVRVWDTGTRRLRFRVRHASQVNCAAFSPDGHTVLTGDEAGKVRLWETATGNALDDLPGHPAQAWSTAFSRDGRTILTAANGHVQLWDRDTRRLRREWASPFLMYNALFYPRQRKVLAVVNGFAQDFDPAAGSRLGPPLFHPEGGIERAVFGPDGQTILISGPAGVARLWDVTTGKPIGPALATDGARPVAAAARSHRFAAGAGSGRVVVWEPPAPVGGTAERVKLWVEVLTGLELDTREAIRELGPEELRQRTL
jgi:WD40 repeat protein